MRIGSFEFVGYLTLLMIVFDECSCFSVLMETVWYNEKKSILRIFLVSTLFSAVQTVSSVNEIEKP